MKERVQAAIDKLGYVPSIAAQRMSGSKSYLILALNDRERTIAHWRAREGSDWIDQMLLGGMLKCTELGYRMIFELVDTHVDEVERELIAVLAALQPDGVILTPPHSDNDQIIFMLERSKIPFARIGSNDDKPGMMLTMDDNGSARLSTQYLIDKGHRRIGFIAGSAEYSLSERRAQGWRETMATASLASDGLLVAGDFSYQSGVIAANRLLDMADRPTAIIASNDQMALAVNSVAAERGLHVPQDLSLISFDNTPVVRFIQPPLTAIDQPIAETVSRAVELIFAATRGHDLPKGPVVVSGRLIERGSVANLD